MLNPWSKQRRSKRNNALSKLAYLRWKEHHYEQTIDFAMDYFFKILGY